MVLLALFRQPLVVQGQDASVSQHPATTEHANMYYYFPDSPSVNLASLKKEIEATFAQAELPITLYPFSHLVDLEKQLHENVPSFLFVPRDYGDSYQKLFRVIPLLQSLRDGAETYEKVLLYADTLDLGSETLPVSRIASTKSTPYCEELLAQVFKDALDVDCRTLRVVTVPKDADAIFALALGQVEMALVSKVNLALINELLPHLEKQFRRFPKTIQVSMPVICAIEGSTPPGKIAKMQEILLKGDETSTSKPNLGILRINGWKRFAN